MCIRDRLDSVIDEGGAVLNVDVPKILKTKLAGIGIAEKGYSDYKITVRSKGGHSSQPPVHSGMPDEASGTDVSSAVNSRARNAAASASGSVR